MSDDRPSDTDRLIYQARIRMNDGNAHPSKFAAIARRFGITATRAFLAFQRVAGDKWKSQMATATNSNVEAMIAGTLEELRTAKSDDRIRKLYNRLARLELARDSDRARLEIFGPKSG